MGFRYNDTTQNILTLTVALLFLRWTSLDLTETVVPRRKGQESVKETRLKQQILRFTTPGQFLDGALVLSTARARRRRNIFSSLEHFEWRGCKPTKYQDFMVGHNSDSDLLPDAPHIV